MLRETSEQERVVPRKRVEALVVVTPEFPERLPKKIASIIKRVQGFEDLALGIRADDAQSWLDLNDLMEMEDVLHEDLVHDIESGGRAFRAFFRNMETKMLSYRDEETPGGHRGALADPQFQKWNRFRLRVDENVKKVLERIQNDRRPIAYTFVYEIIQYALLLSLTEQAINQGLDKTVSEHRARTGLPDMQKLLVQSVIAANLLSVKNGVAQFPYAPKEIFDLLRDGAYAATPEEGIALDNQHLEFLGAPVDMKLKIYSPQDCLILATVDIYTSGSKELIARFAVSRVTGELVPAGVSLVSAKQTFDLMGNLPAYEFIRDTTLLGLYDHLVRGDVQEQPFLSLSTDEQERVTYRTPRPRGRTTPSSESTSAPAAGQQEPLHEAKPVESLSKAAVVPVSAEDSLQDDAPYPSIHQQIKEINRPSESKHRRPFVEWSRSRITWRRVIRALKRIGVVVNVKGAHPKLTYQGHTTRYLNSHEGDSEKNKNELFRVLRELDIAKDLFFASLR